MSEDGLSTSVAPSEPEVPAESDALRELRERLRKHEKPSHIGLRTLLFVASLGAFIWFMRDSGPVVVAVVVGVLAFHELGHLVAMKLLGYENMSVFFVPFMGAAVKGRARKPGGWRAGLVSLAGPVPGILVAAVIMAASPAMPLLRVVAVTLVYVNALNLLPFVPLDGGRLMNTILFSRHRYLELGGTIVGVIGLLAVPDLLPGMPGMWAGLFGGMLIQRSKMIDATSRLRGGNYALEGSTSELAEASLWALHGEANRVLEKTISGERTHTSTMAALHEESATRPAQWHHSLALFLVWGASLGLAWTTYDQLKHPKANWQETVGPARMWSVTFPSPTQSKTTPGSVENPTVHQVFATSPLGEFGVTSFVLEDETVQFEQNPSDTDVRLRSMVTATQAQGGLEVLSQTSLEREGMPALQVTFKTKQGAQLHFLYIARGHAVHALSTVGASADDELRFRQSFQLLR